MAGGSCGRVDRAARALALLAALLVGLMPVEAGWANSRETWQALVVSNVQGSGALPVRVSRDWSVRQPDVVRVVVTIHGAARDADTYDRIAHEALNRAGELGAGNVAAGTMLVTPRFARSDDGTGDAETLRWNDRGWMDGAPAAAPATLSSFDAMDALITRLSDRRMFPSLALIVLVGHSGGGQFVQRYAELSHADERAAQSGIALRYVVANPSSYGYFTPDRPTRSGGFAPFSPEQCRGVDQWKYGMQSLPAYAGTAQPEEIERSSVQRNVTILLGTRDTDPALEALDRSCAAEAQGPNHLDRGHNFFRYLHARHPNDLRQHLHDVPGIGHDPRGMLTSDCALAAIYDAPVCGTANPAPPPSSR